MRVIVRPRQMGKTTELLHESAKTGYPIVTFKYDDIRRLKWKAKELSVNIPEPICYTYFLNGLVDDKKIDGVLIDNAEIIIASLLHTDIPIKGMTISGVPEIDYDERRDCEEYEANCRGISFQEFNTMKYGGDGKIFEAVDRLKDNGTGKVYGLYDDLIVPVKKKSTVIHYDKMECKKCHGVGMNVSYNALSESECLSFCCKCCGYTWVDLIED